MSSSVLDVVLPALSFPLFLMPFIDFVARDDRVSLWYQTNSSLGGVGDFDPEKPVVLMYVGRLHMLVSSNERIVSPGSILCSWTRRGL